MHQTWRKIEIEVRNLRHLTVALAIAVPFFALAGTGGRDFAPLVSGDSRNCFSDALSDLSSRKVQCALAKLESLALDQPISVGIDPKGMPFASPIFDSSLKQGLGIWARALPDSPYVLGNDSARPDILVRFVSKMLRKDEGDLQGKIDAQHEYRWSTRSHSQKLICTMTIVYQTDGRLLTQNEMSEVIAHELGHMLGLTDARNLQGLMGPFVPGRPRLAPSDEEVEAVTEIRGAARDAIARAGSAQ